MRLSRFSTHDSNLGKSSIQDQISYLDYVCLGLFFSLAFLFSGSIANAQSTAPAQKAHALSLIGSPKYPADFKHFDHVNPDAPKGGKLRMATIGSFDTLNAFAITQGDPAPGLALLYDKLMTENIEEPSTEYASLAEWISYPDDFSSVTFKLRDIARWHDGKPITVEDVIFSFETIKKIDPRTAQYYKNVASVEKSGEGQVTFKFDVKNNRELPLILAQLSILPKHYWTGKDQNGNPRDPAKSTLEPPLGSGPYKIKIAEPGRRIIYERVADYWGKDLPVNKGKYNFNEIAFEVYLELNAALEAFKKGQLDFFNTFTAKDWATTFNSFPGFKKGLVNKKISPERKVNSMQAFAFNTRLGKFADPRVRQAFALVMDFESMNQSLFFNQYTRLNSYFDNSELAAKGLPQGQELEILNEVKNQLPNDAKHHIPEEVFTKEYKSPVHKNPQDIRKSLQEAIALLKEAGWEMKNNALTNVKTNEVMKVEFLLNSPTYEKIAQTYIQTLKRLGIQATTRTVDTAQYKRRTDQFDFDIIIHSFPQSLSPGNEQRFFWGSQTAGTIGSYNVVGIKNPAIDKLIDKVIFAKDRAELVAATRALDRVLLWNHYVVPQWYLAYERFAYWDRFAYPKSLAILEPNCDEDCRKKELAKPGILHTSDVGFATIWWYDEAAAKKLTAN